MKARINANELLAAAKFIDAKAVKNRPILQNVKIVVEDNRYIVESTDSFKLIKFTHNNIYIDGAFSCLISADTIKSTVKSSDSFVDITLDAESNAITLDVFNKRYQRTVSVSVDNVDEKMYPTLDGVLDKRTEDKSNVTCLSTVQLTSICNSIACAYDKNVPVKIELGAEHTAVFFSALPNHDEPGIYCDGVVMPMRMSVRM